MKGKKKTVDALREKDSRNYVVLVRPKRGRLGLEVSGCFVKLSGARQYARHPALLAEVKEALIFKRVD